MLVSPRGTGFDNGLDHPITTSLRAFSCSSWLKTSKLTWSPSVTGGFPAKRDSNAQSVSMSWRHHNLNQWWLISSQHNKSTRMHWDNDTRSTGGRKCLTTKTWYTVCLKQKEIVEILFSNYHIATSCAIPSCIILYAILNSQLFLSIVSTESPRSKLVISIIFLCSYQVCV